MWATVIERFQSCVCHFVSETCFLIQGEQVIVFFTWFCVCSGGIKGIWFILSFLDPWKRKRIIAVFRVLAIVFGSGSRIWSCRCIANNQQTRDSSSSETHSEHRDATGSGLRWRTTSCSAGFLPLCTQEREARCRNSENLSQCCQVRAVRT